MKIKATCTRCERECMAEQLTAAGGACPWCGSPAQPDYAVTLVDALRDAEEAGSRLERALGSIADLDPALRLDEGSVTGPLKAALGRIGRNLVRQG